MKTERRFVWAGSGEVIPEGRLTEAQVSALDRFWETSKLGDTVHLYPELLGDAVFFQFHGMTVGVEPDGYIHT